MPSGYDWAPQWVRGARIGWDQPEISNKLMKLSWNHLVGPQEEMELCSGGGGSTDPTEKNPSSDF